MKNRALFLPVLFLTLATAGVCFGQNADGPAEIPSGPLLKPAPAFSQYTITFESPKTKDAKETKVSANTITQIIVTKTGDITSEVTVRQSGTRDELWHVGENQFRKQAGDPLWYASAQPGDGNKINNGYSPMPAIGYRDWDWVGRETFVGVAALDYGSTFVFIPEGAAKPKGAASGISKDQVTALPLAAMVSADTRLPVALQSGGGIQRYTFSPPPTAMQQLPADLTEAIKKAEEGMKRVSQPAPRPF